ncbi:hypothetical protein MUG94_11370 [Arthrobacter gengyunqii]|uniref:Asparagine synthetase domain-containing protein n=1 Tax=Arthrobacter gengyunqii TaxID=2886940 RepID=A0A9X1M409_9MICC|nr:hypothetical protein [Arthrobacter gengyunqii]MCC3269914.1 hypothetical protein [Arthrobacter gengyunqii]UOY95155.1 hypothetical protein MUG94_11370 [Arthrobacter gengyunqii]
MGNAIYGNEALLSASQLVSAIEQSGSVDRFVDSWGRRAKNPSASIIADHSGGRVLVLPDPLGGCIVFTYESGGTKFVSPDLESLVKAADSRGLKPKKSLTYQLERSVIGNGGLTPASYAGVEALQMMDYFQLDLGGSGSLSYPVKREFLSPGSSYSAVLDDYRHDILESLEAIAAIDEYRIAHLTGGFDSRLVLAGIMNGQLESRFRYFCSGPVGTVDRDTADGLAASLGIIRTHDAGLSMATPGSVEEKFLAPMTNSAGLTSSGPLGGEEYSGRVVAGGGYGGLLRSVYSTYVSSSLDQIAPDLIAEKLWGATAMATDGLMTQSSKEGIVARLGESLRELKDDGYEDDYLADAFYLTGRNRYHFGQTSMLWSKVGRRYDPLYSLHGPRLARMLPVNSRKTNVAGFDVMASMQPDLLAYPFDKYRFGGEYGNLRRIPAVKSFVSSSAKFESHAAKARGPVAAVVDPELRQKHVVLSRKLKVNFWQIESMAATQAGLADLLRDLDISDLGEAVNPDYVRLLAKRPLRTRPQIRHLYAVYSMLLWYTKP